MRITVECPMILKIEYTLQIEVTESVKIDEIIAQVLPWVRFHTDRPIILKDKELVILSDQMLRERLAKTQALQAVFPTD